MSTAVRASVFPLWTCSMAFSISYRHRVYLVDRVDLICSLHSWREGFWSPSLATLPLGFNCDFIATSTCGLTTGVCSWGCPGGLGFTPVSARYGSDAAAWVTGVLAAPGPQGGWRLGQQELYCSRRGWKPVLANTLPSILAQRTPWQRSLAGHSLQGHKMLDTTKVTLCTETWEFCLLPVAALPPLELSVKVAQLLGLQGPWWHEVCGDTDCLCSRSSGPIRVFFRASCSWCSEGLFGQPFSIALPLQALRGLPCLGSFSVVQPIRHIEGPPPQLGSYSVDRCIRYLKGHFGWGSTL